MSPNDRDPEEILKRYLPSASKEQMESARGRILRHVKSREALDRVDERLENDRFVRRFVWAWIPALGAVAALLAVAVWAGWIWNSHERYATVETAEGTTFHVGDRVEMGRVLRTSASRGSLRLPDGSRVEMRADSELYWERASDGLRIRLGRGGVIVNAAKQHDGHHLYVQTKDVTVSVIGTVFLVNAEEEGSRVAVIAGEVHVQSGRTLEKLLPGEQVASNPRMQPRPVTTELSWSENAQAHVALMQQSQAALTPPQKLKFDSASIRRDSNVSPTDRPIVGGGSPECQGVDGRIEAGARLGAGQGRCIGNHVSLMWLVAAAYDLVGNRAAQRISGGPDWTMDVWRHGFQINTVAPNPGTATKEDLREMLKTMLEERFKLSISTFMRETDGFIISAGKNGFKLQEVQGSTTVSTEDQPLKTYRRQGPDGTQITVAGKATLKEFIRWISQSPPLVFGPMQDTLDTKGIFAFDFSYLVPPPPPSAGGQRGGGGAGLDGGPAYKPLRDALQEQLGLDLKIGKVQEKVLVIEHVEEPSKN